jgi:glucan 1,3-beta-glucosidase
MLPRCCLELRLLISFMSGSDDCSLRIPIGFWSFDNTGTPYLSGAQDFLDLAIGWARKHKMLVLIDVAGSPGSQNGQAHSGHVGSVEWQTVPGNLNRTTQILVQVARKYAGPAYSDVVFGLELTNEPKYGGNNSFSTTQAWTRTTYKAVRQAAVAAGNPNLLVVMQDAYAGPTQWSSFAGLYEFAMDMHLYQIFTAAANAYTQAQHVSAACGWSSNLVENQRGLPYYVGEFTAVTNACINPDASSTPGSICSVAGCQCISTVQPSAMTAVTADAVLQYVLAQLYVFENYASGYFVYSAKGPKAWDPMKLRDVGAWPPNVSNLTGKFAKC